MRPMNANYANRCVAPGSVLFVWGEVFLCVARVMRMRGSFLARAPSGEMPTESAPERYPNAGRRSNIVLPTPPVAVWSKMQAWTCLRQPTLAEFRSRLRFCRLARTLQHPHSLEGHARSAAPSLTSPIPRGYRPSPHDPRTSAVFSAADEATLVVAAPRHVGEREALTNR